MKTILILSFIALAMSGFVTENEDLYNYLKENAPYEIYEPEENPFRDNQIRKVIRSSTKDKINQENMLYVNRLMHTQSIINHRSLEKDCTIMRVGI